jgi:hypothetical protein
MHGLHAAVMDRGVSDRRPPIQPALVDVFCSSLRQRHPQNLFFV